MKIIAPQEEADSRIDVAPLIDILFTLIIFFLVTSTFEKEEKEEERGEKMRERKQKTEEEIRG